MVGLILNLIAHQAKELELHKLILVPTPRLPIRPKSWSCISLFSSPLPDCPLGREPIYIYIYTHTHILDLFMQLENLIIAFTILEIASAS